MSKGYPVEDGKNLSIIMRKLIACVCVWGGGGRSQRTRTSGQVHAPMTLWPVGGHLVQVTFGPPLHLANEALRGYPGPPCSLSIGAPIHTISSGQVSGSGNRSKGVNSPEHDPTKSDEAIAFGGGGGLLSSRSSKNGDG
jgi:hypothetical protein